MTARFPHMCLALVGCLAAGSASAQVLNESRSSWIVGGQVSDVVRVDNTLYAAGVPQLSVARAGDTTEPFVFLDPVTSAPNIIEGSAPRNGSVNAVVPDGSGGWFVAGSFTEITHGGGGGWGNLAHLTPPSVDQAFKPAVNGFVNGLWKQGTTLYIVGAFTQVNRQARGGGAAFDVTTGALLPWNPALDTTVNARNANAIVANGTTVFVGGNFTTASGAARPGFAAVDAITGALAAAPATTLNAGGTVTALQLSGTTLYVGGTFTAIGAASRANLGALDITTGTVLSFQADTNGPVRRLLLDGGSVYIGGGFTFISGQSRPALARVDAGTGALDAWSPGANGAVTTLVRVGTTLYAGGGFTAIGGVGRVGAAALSTLTGQALAWNPGLSGGLVNVLLQTGAGEILAAGNFTAGGAVGRPGIAAVDIVTNELLPFTIAIDGQIRGITAAGNTLYLAGTFTTVNGQARMNFAAVDRRTAALLPWNPNAVGTIGGSVGGRSVIVHGATAYVGGYFTSVGGQSHAGFAAVDATTGAPLPFAADTGGGGINKLVRSGQTLYAGGNFATVGGQARSGLAAFDLTSGAPVLTPLSITVTATGTPAINAMKVAGSTLYLAGLFNSLNGQSRFQAAAIALPGGAVTAFAPGPNGQVFDIDVLGGVAYVAGGFTQVNGQSRPSFAALDAATGQVLPFVPSSVQGTGSRVIASPEGLVAAGNIGGANLQFFPTTGLAGLPGAPTAPVTFLVPGDGLGMGWTAPAVGGEVTGYQLEIGSGPGLANLAIVPIAGADPEFGYDGVVPPGTYYLRVRAVSAAGVGPASPESVFTPASAVCVGPWPSPIPRVTVDGANVTVAWPDPVLSGPMTYELSASTESGAVNIGRFPTGAAQQLSTAAPPGAYFVRVQGQTACGIQAPSSELLVSVGGVFPLDAPVLTAAVTAGIASLTWTAVPGATGYRLEAGAGPLDASIAMLPLPVTSLSAAVPPGTYYLRVFAVGGPTGQSHASNEVVLIVP